MGMVHIKLFSIFFTRLTVFYMVILFTTLLERSWEWREARGSIWGWIWRRVWSRN